MLDIYTDGSSRQNSSKKWVGAYSWAIYRKGKALSQFSQCIRPGKSSSCELIAAMHAIHESHRLSPNEPIVIHTDSQYVLDGAKHPDKMKTNKELWKLFMQLRKHHPGVTIKHVKGHDKSEFNKHVDSLAKSKLRSQFQNKH